MEKPDLTFYTDPAKQGSIWYYFYNAFSMTRSGIESTIPCSLGERSTTEPPYFNRERMQTAVEIIL